MCYPVQCPRCHKTTWDGCGEHVDEVMRNGADRAEVHLQHPALSPFSREQAQTFPTRRCLRDV